MSLLLEPEPTVLQDNPYSISLPEPASLAEMKAESKRLDLSYELPFDYWTSVGINLVDMGLKADDKGDYVTAFVLLARAFILLGQKLRNHPNYRRKARGETWKQIGHRAFVRAENAYDHIVDARDEEERKKEEAERVRTEREEAEKQRQKAIARKQSLKEYKKARAQIQDPLSKVPSRDLSPLPALRRSTSQIFDGISQLASQLARPRSHSVVDLSEIKDDPQSGYGAVFQDGSLVPLSRAGTPTSPYPSRPTTPNRTQSEPLLPISTYQEVEDGQPDYAPFQPRKRKTMGPVVPTKPGFSGTARAAYRKHAEAHEEFRRQKQLPDLPAYTPDARDSGYVEVDTDNDVESSDESNDEGDGRGEEETASGKSTREPGIGADKGKGVDSNADADSCGEGSYDDDDEVPTITIEEDTSLLSANDPRLAVLNASATTPDSGGSNAQASSSSKEPRAETALTTDADDSGVPPPSYEEAIEGLAGAISCSDHNAETQQCSVPARSSSPSFPPDKSVAQHSVHDGLWGDRNNQGPAEEKRRGRPTELSEPRFPAPEISVSRASSRDSVRTNAREIVQSVAQSPVNEWDENSLQMLEKFIHRARSQSKPRTEDG